MAESKINIRALFDLKGFSTSAQNLERKMKQTANNLNKVGTQMSTAFTLPLVGIAGLAIKSAADFESLRTSLTTSLGGSAEAAKQAFSEIEKFASATPFALEEVTSGFITLKNMGLDPSMAALQSYGNTASSMGKSLNQMVEAVADAAVGEFERLKEFGIKASSEGDRVKFTFKGVTTEVGKNSKEIEQYLQNIGNTEFAGGIEKQGQTFNGVMSTLKDNMALAAASFGELMLPALKKLSTALQELAVWIRGLNPTVKKMIIAFGGVLAIAGPILMFVGALTAAMASLATATGIATAPVLAVVLALAALAAAFVYVKDNLGAFQDFFNNTWVLIKNVFLTHVQAIIIGLSNLFGLLGTKISSGTLEYLESLKSKVIENRREFGSFSSAVKNSIGDVKSNLFGLGETAETVSNKVSNSFSKMTDSVKELKLNLHLIPQGNLIENITNGYDLKVGRSAMPEIVEWADVQAQAVQRRFTEIGTEISEALNNGLKTLAANGAILMGEFLGNVISGSEVSVKDFGRSLLDAIGMFMQDFGKAMIAIGIAQAGIDLAIKSMNPALAIAGGIALVAAGTALSNISKKGLEGAGAGGAGGYNSPSGSMNRNNLDLQPIVLETKIQGRELILVQDRSRQFKR